MLKKIEEAEFTIFDTETTGLDPASGDRIVEIAAVRLKGKKKRAVFQSLINPGRGISEAAFSINRITPEMLKGAPKAQEIIPDFLGFIKGSCLCSYNAMFDLDFLNNELKLIGRPVLADTPIIDILKMAKKLLPGLERYALWFVAEKMGIKKQQQHRALSDVELTLSLFDKLRRILDAKEIHDFTNFCGLFGIDPVLLASVNSHKLAKIQEAINLGVKLKIRYLSNASAEVTEREVSPREIRQDKNSSYLIGHCSLRKDERTFKVDNILRLEIV